MESYLTSRWFHFSLRLFDEMLGVNPGEWVTNAKGILKTARGRDGHR